MKYRDNFSKLGKFISVSLFCLSLFTAGCAELKYRFLGEIEEPEIEDSVKNMDIATVIEKCNIRKDYQYCRRAAEEGGDPLSQFNLALAYRLGHGIRAYPEKAFYWYKKVAEQGNAEAQYEIASMYYDGYGVKRNTREAVRWWHESAARGYPESQDKLGFMYFYGEWVREDRYKAIEYYRLACNSGYRDSCDMLRVISQYSSYLLP